MKASELIEDVAKQIAKYGDCEVICENTSRSSIRLAFKDKDGEVHPMFLPIPISMHHLAKLPKDEKYGK